MQIFCEVYACYQSNCQQTANSVRKSVSLIVQVTVSTILLSFCKLVVSTGILNVYGIDML